MVGASFHVHTETNHVGNTLALCSQPATSSFLDAINKQQCCKIFIQLQHNLSLLYIKDYNWCSHVTYNAICSAVFMHFCLMSVYCSQMLNYFAVTVFFHCCRKHLVTVSNWSKVGNATTKLGLVIMATLRSRCGHYIFIMWFLLSIYLFFLA